MFTYGICSSQLPDLETFVLCLRWVEIQGNISVEGIQVLAQVWLLLWNWKKNKQKPNIVSSMTVTQNVFSSLVPSDFFLLLYGITSSTSLNTRRFLICVPLHIVMSNRRCVVLFVRLVCSMLPVSLDSPFLIAPSVFSNVCYDIVYTFIYLYLTFRTFLLFSLFCKEIFELGNTQTILLFSFF